MNVRSLVCSIGVILLGGAAVAGTGGPTVAKEIDRGERRELRQDRQEIRRDRVKLRRDLRRERNGFRADRWKLGRDRRVGRRDVRRALGD